MHTTPRTGNIKDIEFSVIYSGRRTIGISILPDSSVILRVPYRTSDKTISRIVNEKAPWIIKHRDNYRISHRNSLSRSYTDGEIHMFRGKKVMLKTVEGSKQYVRFNDDSIELGQANASDSKKNRQLLYKGYRREANIVFPEIFDRVIKRYEDQDFRPNGLLIRSMKRRWGSCSGKGVITLSTELIKLSDTYIEYVIVHELCHLRHHNHGSGYYKLLTELFPDWKKVRTELKHFSPS